MAFNLINTIDIIIIVSVIIIVSIIIVIINAIIMMTTTFLLLWLLALSTLSATSSLSQEFAYVLHEPKSFLFSFHRNSSWLTSYPQSQCGFHWRFTLILLPRVEFGFQWRWFRRKLWARRLLDVSAQQLNRPRDSMLENQNRVETNRGTRKASAAHLITVPLWLYNTFIFTLVNLCYSSDVSTVWTPHCTVHSHDLCSLRHITPQDSFLLWSLRLERKQNRTEQQLVQDLGFNISLLRFSLVNSNGQFCKVIVPRTVKIWLWCFFSAPGNLCEREV